MDIRSEVTEMISGHITVCKVYKDGTKETVLDRANLITGGLGSSFIDIQRNQGSAYAEDYTPRYFQVGTDTIGWSGHVREASSTFYQLSAPFTWSDYGEDTNLNIVQRYRGFNASTVNSGRTYNELLMTSAMVSAITFSGEDQYFGEITAGSVTKFFVDSFEAEIVLDENTANGKSITELGLFAKNPKGFNEDSPLLMAYRSFAPLAKTAQFSLVVHWVVGFLGLSTNPDEHYTGSYVDPGNTSIRGQDQPKGGPNSIQ